MFLELLFLFAKKMKFLTKADSYGNEKLIRKWTKYGFLVETKNLVRVKLMATCYDDWMTVS